MALVLLDDFKEGDLITIIWDKGDKPIFAEVIKIDRGFIVYCDKDSNTKGVARPGSPYKITKSQL